MDTQLVELDLADWAGATPNEAWIAALEAGKVLYFPRLGFELRPQERELLTPSVLSPDVRPASRAFSASKASTSRDMCVMAFVPRCGFEL